MIATPNRLTVSITPTICEDALFVLLALSYPSVLSHRQFAVKDRGIPGRAKYSSRHEIPGYPSTMIINHMHMRVRGLNMRRVHEEVETAYTYCWSYVNKCNAKIYRHSRDSPAPRQQTLYAVSATSSGVFAKRTRVEMDCWCRKDEVAALYVFISARVHFCTCSMPIISFWAPVSHGV